MHYVYLLRYRLNANRILCQFILVTFTSAALFNSFPNGLLPLYLIPNELVRFHPPRTGKISELHLSTTR